MLSLIILFLTPFSGRRRVTSRKRASLFLFFSHVHELRRGKARGLYQLLTAICCSDNDDSSRARAFGSVDASHLKIYPYISGSWPWLACPILRSPTFWPHRREAEVVFLLSSSYVQQPLRITGFLAVRFVFIGAKESDKERERAEMTAVWRGGHPWKGHWGF